MSIQMKQDPLFRGATLLPREAVQAEAERRLSIGFLMPDGHRFRCDDASISRLSGMLTAAERSEAAGKPYAATFRTAAGVEMQVSNAGDVGNLFDLAETFVNAVLKRSSELQADPPVDVQADRHWP